MNITISPAIFFLLSCFFNASFVVFTKLLGNSFSIYELAVYRTAIILLVSATFIMIFKKRLPSFSKVHALFFLKSIFALLSMVTWFTTIKNLPISETIAISFSTPILTSALAVIILREQFTFKHLVAFICGSIGMFIIASPEIGKMNQYALIGLLSCFFLSVSFIIIKFLLKYDYDAIEINYFGNMIMLPMSFALTLFVTENSFTELKSSNEMLLVMFFGFCIFLADFFHNLSYKKGSVTTLMPLMFTTIILGAVYDYLIFDTLIDENVIIGAIIVIAGILYLNFGPSTKKVAKFK